MAITNTPTEQIIDIVAAQKELFLSGKTLDLEFRISALKALKAALRKWEKPLAEALWADLHKSKEEAFLTELSIVMGEIKNHLKHLKKWMRREKYSTPLKMTPSRSYVVSEPLGSALIIGGVNGDDVKLFETDPSGALIEYKATAIGSGVQAAMDVFEERYEDDISLEDAINLGLDALYEATEGRTTAQSVEIAVIEVDTQSYRKLSDDEVSEYVEALLERNAEEEEEESEEEAEEEVVEEKADEDAEAEASEETSEDEVDENVAEESDDKEGSEE